MVDVEATSVYIGNVADVVEGTVSVAEVLAAMEVIGVSMLLELAVKVASVVRGAVGVTAGPDDVDAVPFVAVVVDGAMMDVESVPTVTGITEAPDVLNEYEPVDIPVPVMIAVPEALDDASDDAALDRIPENSEDSDADAAG